MFNHRNGSSRKKYVGMFVWLCVCTVFFSFLSPFLQRVSHAVVRFVVGTQKIAHAPKAGELFVCAEGTSAIMGTPFDATFSGRSQLVFAKEKKPSLTDHAYVFTKDGTTVLGQVDTQAAHPTVMPFFSLPEDFDAYTSNKTHLRIKGTGVGTFKSEIPKDATVSVGDFVSVIVGGHMKTVGIVSAVHDAPQSPTKNIIIRTPEAPTALQDVCVVSL